MELTRRDAIVALFGGGGMTAVAGRVSEITRDETGVLETEHVDRLLAVADVLYPSGIDVSEEFLETYVFGRIEERESFRMGLIDSLDWVENKSHRRYGQSVETLPSTDVDTLLRGSGVDKAHPVPDGTAAEQFRYYVVNDLLYAFYATPVGGELVGYENPDGYPGGLAAYQRGPDT